MLCFQNDVANSFVSVYIFFIIYILFCFFTGKTLRLWVLCASFTRASKTEVFGWNPILDGSRGYFKITLRTRGMSYYKAVIPFHKVFKLFVSLIRQLICHCTLCIETSMEFCEWSNWNTYCFLPHAWGVFWVVHIFVSSFVGLSSTNHFCYITRQLLQDFE